MRDASQYVRPLWRAIVLVVLVTIAACHSRRSNFMARVREDCSAGQQWACDLLDALSRQPSANDVPRPDSGPETP
jgi:hypothetical protein